MRTIYQEGPPAAMVEHEVSIASGAHSLRGSLRLAGGSAAPAALLISGSGPLDRDSNSTQAPVGVAAELATFLAGLGISTLRYDKRGIGGSDGDYYRTGLHDNVADARAALDVLRSHESVDPANVVVIGHSEGALIAAELGADPTLAGVALLAGTAQRGRDVLIWQAEQIAPTLPRAVRSLMRVLRQDIARTQRKRMDRIAASEHDVMRMQGVKLNARWMREFMAYEPAPALLACAVPVLAVTGAKDVQVDPDDIDRIADLVSVPFAGHVVADLSHLLRHDPGTKGVRSYKAQLRRPVDGRVLAVIGEWVLARAR